MPAATVAVGSESAIVAAGVCESRRCPVEPVVLGKRRAKRESGEILDLEARHFLKAARGAAALPIREARGGVSVCLTVGGEARAGK